MLKSLNFQSLGDVDGGAVRIAMDHALQKAYLDMSDRPGLDKPRKITLTIELKPEKSERGELVGSDVGFTIDAKHPAKSTKVRMSATTNGLRFQEHDRKSPNQMAVDDVADVE